MCRSVTDNALFIPTLTLAHFTLTVSSRCACANSCYVSLPSSISNLSKQVMPGVVSTVPDFGIAILAGGSSSRMGIPKHLLTDVDGIPMYLSQLRMLHNTFPDAKHLCIMVQNESQRATISIPRDVDARVLSQETLGREVGQTGPATAVFSASTFDHTCHWLIVPCDYPLLAGSELRHLCIKYRDPVTCFRNGNGEIEPLVAMWNPEALSHIDIRTMRTRDDLSVLIERLAGTKISPVYDHSLFNTNTKEDWDDAMQLLLQSRINHLPDQSSDYDV